jgi:hypothetical protein
VTTAVDKQPAYDMTLAVASGELLIHSSYTTTEDTTGTDRGYQHHPVESPCALAVEFMCATHGFPVDSVRTH